VSAMRRLLVAVCFTLSAHAVLADADADATLEGLREKVHAVAAAVGIDADHVGGLMDLLRQSGADKLTAVAKTEDSATTRRALVEAIAPVVSSELDSAFASLDVHKIHQHFRLVRKLGSASHLYGIILEAPTAIFGVAVAGLVSLLGSTGVVLKLRNKKTEQDLSHGVGHPVEDALLHGLGAAWCLFALQYTQTHLLPHLPALPLFGKIDVIFLPPHAPTTMILLFASSGPAAVPKTVLLSHVVSAAAAWFVLNLVPEETFQYIDCPSLCSVLAMVTMTLTHFVHPPAAAYAFLVGKNNWTGLKPFFAPGFAGCVVLLIANMIYSYTIGAIASLMTRKVKRS